MIYLVYFFRFFTGTVSLTDVFLFLFACRSGMKRPVIALRWTFLVFAAIDITTFLAIGGR